MIIPYQLKKKAIGGYVISYNCPHCQEGLNSSLNEAGTTQACPTCNNQFVVPGKAERDQLHAKQEAERKANAEAKQREQQERARQKQIAEEQTRKELSELGARQKAQREYQESHCPYCWEAIKPGVKKCKHCHEYLEKDLLASRHTQDVVRFRPPLEDIIWLVLKFWVASFVLFFALWVIVIAFLAAIGISIGGAS